jgi:hypothetical protein
MAKTPIPIHVMKAAYDEEYALWTYDRNHFSAEAPCSVFRDGCQMFTGDGQEALYKLQQLRSDASWRAALRALAEMEPTKDMKDAATGRGLYVQGGPVTLDDYAKAYILAAAYEGHKDGGEG